jgi:hypothetical protein
VRARANNATLEMTAEKQDSERDIDNLSFDELSRKESAYTFKDFDIPSSRPECKFGFFTYLWGLVSVARNIAGCDGVL